MTEKTGDKGKRQEMLVPTALLFFVTGGAVCAFSHFTHAGRDAVVRNTVCACIGAGILVFLLRERQIAGKTSAFTKREWKRFLFSYGITLFAALFLTFLPWQIWPYMALFALLGLSSDRAIGMYAASFLLVISCLFLREAAFYAYACHLMAGAGAIALFCTTQKGTKIGTGLLTALIVQALSLTAFDLLYLHRALSLRTFTVIALCLFLNGLLLVLFVKEHMMHVTDADDKRYPEINDTEFSLMAAIRTKSRDEYFRAIHVAYLSERVAQQMGLRAPVTKTLAMYHRIGCLDETDSIWSEVAHYFHEFEFPEEAMSLLREYITMGKKGPEAKETTIVFLCEMLIARLTQEFAGNKDRQVFYDDVIDKLFEEVWSSGQIRESALSVKEYLQTRQLLKKEKLYYDMLR